MARWQPLQFVGGAYTDDATPWTSQDRVNYIPVSAEKAGTRSPQMLRQAPGCRLFTADGVASPVRGLHSAEGLLVAVKGQTLYSYDSEGAATSLGTIPGVKRCSIAHNQITSGNQIAIANGSSGYVYNTVTGVLAQITDEGFPGAKVFDFVDQYIVGVEPAGRYWFHSDLSAATDYNTLDRYEAETAPDKIVTLIATHGEVFVLGERTSEFFYNTGQATGTFQRRDAGMEIGCAAQHSVVRLDNSVVWLGHDGSVYRLNGYQPQRISTHAIEQAIARCNVADAYAFTFEDRGHKVYYLTFTDGQTFGFDMATGLWHRRKSYGLDFWRMSHLVRWGRTWVGGDYTNGSLYILDWRRNDDAGEPLERINTLAPIHDNGNRLIVNAIKIEIDAGKTSESFPPAYEPPAPSITGDVPDGMVGDEVDYSYTVTGGVNPVSVSVGSGTPPPGLTFNSDGTVEGTYTTAGSYSWVMLATGADGNVATTPDSAEVASTFPSWLETTTTLISVAIPTHTVGNPPIVEAGDLLIYVQWSIDVDFAPPVGYAAILTGPNGRRAYTRTADGTEGGTTVNFINGAGGGRTGEYFVIRIRSGRWGSVYGRSDTGDNPPPFTPAGGLDKYLWIAAMVGTITGSLTYPHPDHQISGTTMAACGAGIEAATNDPSTWTVSGEMISIAVAPP